MALSMRNDYQDVSCVLRYSFLGTLVLARYSGNLGWRRLDGSGGGHGSNLKASLVIASKHANAV
jgi:hypothetical protein